MNDQACEALGRVLRHYGPSICNTPRSCEMFIRQECGAYPEESKALIEALRQGVTAELMTYQPVANDWDPVASKLCTRLVAKGMGETEGTWAVDAWAKALGRHPETFQSAPLVEAAPIATYTPATPRQLRMAMTAVVSLGGGLGAACGSILIPAGMLLTMASAKIDFVSQPVRSSSRKDLWVTVILVLLLISSVNAVAGAVGAAIGWLYGKGDRGHWTGFGTSFGAAFASSALGTWACSSFGSPFGAFIAAFCAATTTARRGGFA
jgi:hypothetical protein